MILMGLCFEVFCASWVVMIRDVGFLSVCRLRGYLQDMEIEHREV
jgi:hypothetical protein